MDSAAAASTLPCARERNDPRIQRLPDSGWESPSSIRKRLILGSFRSWGKMGFFFWMLDGRQQAKQKHPGFHAAIARFDALAAKKPAAVLEAEAEGESGFGKGMFGVGEIVFCEVA